MRAIRSCAFHVPIDHCLRMGHHASLTRWTAGLDRIERVLGRRLETEESLSTIFELVRGSVLETLPYKSRERSDLGASTSRTELNHRTNRPSQARIIRAIMNAELAAAGQVRILIPVVYRSNFVSALRALSVNAWPEAIIKALAFAQRYCCRGPMAWSPLPTSKVTPRG